MIQRLEVSGSMWRMWEKMIERLPRRKTPSDSVLLKQKHHTMATVGNVNQPKTLSLPKAVAVCDSRFGKSLQSPDAFLRVSCSSCPSLCTQRQTRQTSLKTENRIKSQKHASLETTKGSQVQNLRPKAFVSPSAFFLC